MEDIVGHLHWSQLRLLLKMYISGPTDLLSQNLRSWVTETGKETPLMNLMPIKVERLLVRN